MGEDAFKHAGDKGDEDLLAYSSLGGQCLNKKIAEYNYEICFFKSAKQDSTRVGNWKMWTAPHVGLFSGGQTCPGGPARSLKVNFGCGKKFEIEDITEPSRCTYEAKMTHPAACSEERLKAAVIASTAPRNPKADEL